MNKAHFIAFRVDQQLKDKLDKTALHWQVNMSKTIRKILNTYFKEQK